MTIYLQTCKAIDETVYLVTTYCRESTDNFLIMPDNQSLRNNEYFNFLLQYVVIVQLNNHSRMFKDLRLVITACGLCVFDEVILCLGLLIVIIIANKCGTGVLLLIVGHPGYCVVDISMSQLNNTILLKLAVMTILTKYNLDAFISATM